MAHVLIYGSDHLAYRIAEQVRAEGFEVIIIARAGSWLASAGLQSNASGLCNTFLSEGGTTTALLQAAGVEQVETLFAVSDVDEANLGLALAVLELNPNLRVVLRQFNMRLGVLLEEYLPRCAVMSLSALAAPTFAVAACTAGVRFAHGIGEDMLVLREENVETSWRMNPPTGSRVVVALERDELHWFPSTDRAFQANTKLLIASTARELATYPPTTQKHFVTKSRPTWRTQRILLGVIAYLAFVVICASLYFYLWLGMGALNALYFVITIITSVGFGDFNLRDADALSKVIGMLLMLSGVGITAVVFALITDGLVARQHAFDRGRVRHRLSDHTIVCGLGVVGLRVAQKLQQMGSSVICVEKDEDNRFLAEARGLGIPVVIGSALQEQTLRYANIEQARSLVVCSNPDHLNLEIALNARSLRRELPIVLRMFDPDLARRVANHFRLETTFSSAALVAPFFAAQATGSTRLFSLQFHDRTLDFHRLKISGDEDFVSIIKRYDGRLVAAVDAVGRLRFEVEDLDNFKPESVLITRSAA